MTSKRCVGLLFLRAAVSKGQHLLPSPPRSRSLLAAALQLLPVDPFVSSYTWVRGGKERQEKTVHFFSATPKGEPRAFPNSEVKDGRWTTLDGIDSLTGGKIPADVKTMLVELAGRAEPHLPTTVPDSAPTAPASAGSTGGAAATV